jgi:hypothetical protein
MENGQFIHFPLSLLNRAAGIEEGLEMRDIARCREAAVLYSQLSFGAWRPSSSALNYAHVCAPLCHNSACCALGKL